MKYPSDAVLTNEVPEGAEVVFAAYDVDDEVCLVLNTDSAIVKFSKDEGVGPIAIIYALWRYLGDIVALNGGPSKVFGGVQQLAERAAALEAEAIEGVTIEEVEL